MDETQLKTNEAGIANSAARILPKGTVCLSRTASVGFVAIMGQPMATSQDFANWVCGDELDPEFLMYALIKSRRFLREIAAGATHKTIYMPALQTFHICHPDREKQRRIVVKLKAQLTEVTKARRAAQAQLCDGRLLRTRTLKSFFAELGRAPKKKLGDCAETTSGSTPSRGDRRYWQPAEIAWVKTAEVAFKPITFTEEAISKIALAECSLSLLPPKTILVAMYGQGKTRGQSAILEIPATTNQACFAILPNDTWETDFLDLWLKSSYQELRDLSEDRGGNQANLNGALLKALEVPAPSRVEQREIVARIAGALTEINALEISSKLTLEEINHLPERILKQTFEM